VGRKAGPTWLRRVAPSGRPGSLDPSCANLLRYPQENQLRRPFDAVEIGSRVKNLLELNQARREQQRRAAHLVREVAKAVPVVEAREQEIVTRLARAAEHRDNDTGDHIARVAGYVELMAAALGIPPDRCKLLARASTMHDVGKIAVPDAILLKQGPLTPEERQVMERHAEKGYRILEGSA
jgi:putative two-component system response regulator